jgi:hypothetical protein
MGFRFRRSVKILPGIRINLSRSGISTSVGVRGAHVTLGRGNVRTTVGVPGTGLSYTESHNMHSEAAANESAPESTQPSGGAAPRGWLWIILFAICVFAYLLRY